MKMPSLADIRRAVLDTVQPLYSGIFETTDGLRATLKDVIPFGTIANFQAASPFGLISKPAKGVLGYCLNLQGRMLAPVILAHLDAKRPVPSAPGEVIVYCTNEVGDSQPVKLTLKNDGTLQISSTLKVQVLCENIELGSAGLEKIVSGETFKTFFNAHQHLGNLGAPTGAPIVPMADSELSAKVKAAK
jgi:hypothetical protein